MHIPLYRGNLHEDLTVVARNRLAEHITGGLAKTGKMPEYSWGIPATRCKIGALLARKEGTVCSQCYALKNRYRMPNVKYKLAKRYEGLAHPLWTPSMIFLVRWKVSRHFRWMDSGDLQSISHLRNICTIAENVPDVQFWLPTREYDIVRAVETFPDNLTIRLSAHHIDGPPPDWPTTSTVGRARNDAYQCPALDQGNRCGECRACWSQDVPNVNYVLH